MTWSYNETTHQALDADGPIGSTVIIAPGSSNVAFEGDEDYVGKYWGTGPSAPSVEVITVEGSNAASAGGIQMDLGSGNEIDITTVLYQFWFLYTAKTGETLEDANSVQLRVADSGETSTQTNYYRYDLTGAVDAGDFYQPLFKSWNHFVVGGANRGTQVGTSTDLTDIRWVTCWLEWVATNNGNDPGFAFDWLKSGNKFTCTGTETLAGLRSFDEGDPADRNADPDYGNVQGTGIFYEIWSAVDVGNGSTSTTLTVEDSFVNFRPYAEEIPYDWTVTNNATLTLGRLDDQAQEDYPVGGNTFASDNQVYLSSFAFENGSTGNLYGGRFFQFDDFLLGEAAAGTDPTIDIRSYDFDTIRNIEFRSTNLDIIDTQFHDPLPTFLNASAAWRDDNGSYTDITTNWNNTTTATTIFPATEVVDQDGHIFGYSEQFTAVEFEISTAGVGGAVTFQYWNGSSWTSKAT